MDLQPETCRLSQRRKAIITAARNLFVEQGYERTTLEQIVVCAGGSLATIYKLFGNKDRLFEEVVLESAASGEALVQRIETLELAPSVALHRIAQALYKNFLNSEVVSLVRVVISRSICDPDFAHQFFDRTATKTRKAIETMFARWEANGIAMNGKPEFLAEIFMGLIVGDLQTQAITHSSEAPDLPERLRERTDFFIVAAGIDIQN